jgi:excisionase family DNA binding protein
MVDTLETRLLYSIRGAATAMSCGVGFVREAVKSGQLPAFRFGNAYRIRVEDLTAFVEKKRQAHKGTAA